jgi:hypothetical protein
MLGFILEGQNPNDYGFEVSNDFYKLILKNFDKNAVMSVGVKYEWQCLQDKAKVISKPYIIKDENSELEYFNTFVNLNLDEIVNKNQEKVQKQNELKFKIINKFPKLFQLYLDLRRKL